MTMTDPDFPDRPDHPDFWMLSKAVLDLDDQAETGQPVDDIVDRYVDHDAAYYMAEQRARRAAARMGKGPALPRYRAIWMDGFTLGMAYQDLKAREREQQAGHG
jgi:hypothetical protein